MKYIQVSVTTTTQASDIVGYILMENGSEGVNIKDSNDIAEMIKGDVIWDYIDESLLVEDKRVLVTGYYDLSFDLCPIRQALDDLKQNATMDVGSLEISVSELDSQDWENVWKQYYKPIEIGKIVIVPKWIKRKPDEHIEVLIDPGMAFGTGNHETTSMCVELLDGLNVKGKHVADIGCGSGILGITALKLGAESCVMSDIDSQAVEAAKQNAILNEVDAEIICGDLCTGNRKFDIVVANITADILIRLSGIIGNIVKDNGIVIISGIINDRADDVLKSYSAFTLNKRIRKGEWQAFEFVV